MKKRIISAILCLIVLVMGFSITGCSANKSQTLNLYTWEGMFPKEVLDSFESKYNIKINYSNFDFDEDMLAKLEETKGGDYDLVFADDYIIDMAKNENLIQKLDTSKISTLKNINPVYQSQFFDENNEYTVPYGAGIPLIVYDPDKVGFEIKSYNDLWNTALKDSIAITGNYRVIDGIVLKTMGESFNTENIDTIKKAGEKLLQLAPNIRVISDNNTQDYIISGEVSAAFMYTPQVIAALQANPNLKVAYPSEGLGFGVMAGFIPSKAPNSDAAHKFLEYINEPENAAKCFEYVNYYCTNKAAEDFLSDDMKTSLTLPDYAKDTEIIKPISNEAEDAHSTNWENFRNAAG